MANTSISNEFTNLYSDRPHYIIKAPGRVNLIGEHTDYNGFPVLPVSIPFSITAAVSPRTDTIVSVANLNPDYKPERFELSGSLIPHSPQGHWSNYVKAAANTLMDHSGGGLRGFNALFSGDIPSSAGLSSSSAMVIASALALTAANNIKIDPLELAELMAVGERYVGTQGGGMDQAICILGRKNYALKLDFFPLRSQQVPFLPGHSIIVAHSLITASKTKSTMYKFNTRSAECRLSTALINAVYKPEIPLARLGDLTNHGFFLSQESSETFIGKLFEHDRYPLEKIAALTGESPSSITYKYLLSRDGSPLPTPPGGFSLRSRTLHVLTEAERVEESCRVLADNDPLRFGALMSASHRSCSELYGISTPELDELVTIMTESGALGARLTGAGFGGCAIALVSDDRTEKVMDNIRQLYYTKYMAENHPELMGGITSTEHVIFPVKPDRGATITEL